MMSIIISHKYRFVEMVHLVLGVHTLDTLIRRRPLYLQYLPIHQ